MDHVALRELTAGAALDDLDPAERRTLDRHIANCPGCAALAAELADVLADLALVAPELEPPAGVWLDLLAAIRADPAARPRLHLQALVAGPAPVLHRRGAAHRPSRLPAVAGLAAAAVFGLVAVGLGVRAQSLEAQLAAARGDQAGGQAVLAVAADPAHQTAALLAPGHSGSVVWLPGRPEAWLIAHGLPPTPSGSVYQLWHADASGVHPLGTVVHDGEGPLIAPFGVDLAASEAAMVTLEPAGGTQGEPGAEILFGEL